MRLLGYIGRLTLLALIALSLTLAPPVAAASKRKKASAQKQSQKSRKPSSKKGKKGASKAQQPPVAEYQGPHLPVYQGPPLPPAPVQFRAAGVCLSYEPGIFIMVAEIGGTGRVFRLEPDTLMDVKPKRGGRVRILYVDAADGPVARRVMQGAVEAGATRE